MIDDFLCLSIFKLVINSVFLEGGFGLFIDILKLKTKLKLIYVIIQIKIIHIIFFRLPKLVYTNQNFL